MSKITQKQLIDQIKILQEIKPRKEWASLLKSQILIGGIPEKTAVKAESFQTKAIGILEVLENAFLKRKLAYSFAALVFVVVGLVGFAQYTMPGDALFPIKKIAEQSEAALTGQTSLRQSVAALGNRINDLAVAAKEGKKNNIPSVISEVKNNASELAKNLKNNSVDTATIKEIAVSLKTLANVPGTDLTANTDVKDLYQAIIESQLADLQKATLTDEQKESLTEAQDLYDQQKYVEALEKILLIK
jgi:Na+-transporting NADH:ubiquinone oxidoreductase subunit NqrC